MHPDLAGLHRHSTRCATGECSRGHNRVRDVLFACLREEDTGAHAELIGLIAQFLLGSEADIIGLNPEFLRGLEAELTSFDAELLDVLVIFSSGVRTSR